MDAVQEIKLVRDNLALAIGLWTGVKKGNITVADLSLGRTVLNSEPGKLQGFFNPLELKGEEDLLRFMANQVRAAFALALRHSFRQIQVFA